MLWDTHINDLRSFESLMKHEFDTNTEVILVGFFRNIPDLIYLSSKDNLFNILPNVILKKRLSRRQPENNPLYTEEK